MKFLTLNCLLISLIISACNNRSGNKKEESIEEKTPVTGNQSVFDKMIGSWQNEDGKSFERWTKNDDGTFRSVAFSVAGKDTSWNEQANIYPENDNWVFENTVKGQNDGKAVKFVSSIFTENTVQFSNPAHDFPTDINYTVTDANSLHAFIVGPNSKGGKDTIPFNYKRIAQ